MEGTFMLIDLSRANNRVLLLEHTTTGGGFKIPQQIATYILVHGLLDFDFPETTANKDD